MIRTFCLVACGLAVSALSLSRAALAQTPEDLEIERAGRYYRLWVYETFRHNRPEFDRRYGAGQELLQSWRTAGQPASSRDQVLAWLADATPRSGAVALPPLPTITRDPSAPQEALVDAAPAPLPPLSIPPAEPATTAQPAPGVNSTQVSLELPKLNLDPKAPEKGEKAANEVVPPLFQSIGSAVLKATGLEP
jgi:hypothetical protein